MNSLELEVVSLTSEGGAHVKLNDGRENLGVLYLDKRQYEAIIGILTTGCFQKDIDFTIENPYETDDQEDNFFDYDE